MSPVYIRGFCWFIWQAKRFWWHVAWRPSLCPTVLIRGARGAAVKAGKAKICELKRAEGKIYIKRMKAAITFFCNLWGKEKVCSDSKSLICPISIQVVSYPILYSSCFIANSLQMSHCSFCSLGISFYASLSCVFMPVFRHEDKCVSIILLLVVPFLFASLLILAVTDWICVQRRRCARLASNSPLPGIIFCVLK